jgi:hypothetical protein
MEIKEFHPHVLDAGSIEKVNSLSNEELAKLAEVYPTRQPFLKAKSKVGVGNFDYKGLLSQRTYNFKPEVIEILSTAKEVDIKPFHGKTFNERTTKTVEVLQPVRVEALEVKSPETATNEEVSENVETMDAIVSEDAKVAKERKPRR